MTGVVFSHEQLPTLEDVRVAVASVGGDAVAARQFLKVVDGVSRGGRRRQPLLSALAREVGVEGEVSAAIIRASRDLFLSRVNRRLQAVYRRHLQAISMSDRATSSECLAALQVIADECTDIIRDEDLPSLVEWCELAELGEGLIDCLVRLSRFAMPCERVNLRFTHHCNVRCAHCYNHSGPEARGQRLDLNQMLSVIAEMPSAQIWNLNITGGEPFLYFDDLTALVGAARAARLRQVSIYSNGFWGTEEHAIPRLQALRDAGFNPASGDFIKISTGVYHQEYLPICRAATAANAYASVFGRSLRLDVEILPPPGASTEDVWRQLRAAGLAADVMLTIRSVAPVGRGATLPVVRRPAKDIGRCTLLEELAFDPNGSVRPCCGFNTDNNGIRVGTIGQGSLNQMASDMQNDPVLQLLSRSPMATALTATGTQPRAEGYWGACDLCQDALGRLVDKPGLQARLAPEQEYFPFEFWHIAADVERAVVKSPFV